ncbi:uncharacterized protein LOC129599667 [Paramacrobiotus metropolitanus]|uniref:uncharacterized protein LOC129599667 n=1 Tax=Paramacrobiotus metropolitanus TaxID=2943436 RepID=UPI0024465727|nr:uncharacterized protein LOC129599667 [Paramacrobiotus metropolitanus]
MLGGSVLSDSLYRPDPEHDTFELARRTGHSVNSQTSVAYVAYQMFRYKKFSEIIRYAVWNVSEPTVPYGLVIDKSFLIDTPFTAPLRGQPSGYILTGYSRKNVESLLKYARPELFDQKTPLKLERLRDLVARWSAVETKGGLANCTTYTSDAAQGPMQRYTIRNPQDRNDTLSKLLQLITDSRYAYPSVREALRINSRNAQLFRIDYDHELDGFGSYSPNVMQLSSPIFGSSTAMEFSPEYVEGLRDMLRQVVHNGQMKGSSYQVNGEYLQMNQTGHWNSITDGKPREVFQFWDSRAQHAEPCVKINSCSLIRVLNTSILGLTKYMVSVLLAIKLLK